MTGALVRHEGGAAFDYAALIGNVATAAREAADRIRERIRGQQVAIFDIGRDLIAMKEALGHGHFLAWIEAEFGMNERSAQRFMGVADALGAKSDTVSDLPPTVLYALSASSTPSELRDELVARHEAGEVRPDEIKDRLNQERAAARERRADAKLTPGQRKHRRRVAKTVEQEERERQKRVAQRDALVAEAVGAMVERFGNDLPAFVALLGKVDSWYFRRALEEAAARAETAKA